MLIRFKRLYYNWMERQCCVCAVRHVQYIAQSLFTAPVRFRFSFITVCCSACRLCRSISVLLFKGKLYNVLWWGNGIVCHCTSFLLHATATHTKKNRILPKYEINMYKYRNWAIAILSPFPILWHSSNG